MPLLEILLERLTLRTGSPKAMGAGHAVILNLCIAQISCSPFIKGP